MAKLTWQHGMPELKLTRSSHNLSNKTLFDVDQGRLVPTAVYDVVPGDKFNLGSSALIRTTPLVKPAFTIDLKAKSISAYVAYRTIWKPFEEFFAGGRTGNKKVPLPFLAITSSNIKYLQPYTLMDYFGLPVVGTVSDSGNKKADFINALYFLSYLKIWNDYFRNPSIDIEIDVFNLTIYKPNDDTPYTFTPHDVSLVFNGVSYPAQNIGSFINWCCAFISNLIPVSTDINPSVRPPTPDNTKDNYTPALVNLPRDYFTSALPTASGPNEVSLNLTGSLGSAPFDPTKHYYAKVTTPFPISTQGLGITSKVEGSNTNLRVSRLTKGSLSGVYNGTEPVTINGAPSTEAWESSMEMSVDVSGMELNKLGNSSSVSISGIYPRELRLVFGLDLKNQIRNLTGNRYQDLTKAFYGIDVQDFRVNKAEYIGGAQYPIYTSEVLQTSESGSTPLGDQAGHNIASGVSNHGSYFVRELGCIMNLFWINSSSVYGQGIRRDWRKFSINDFFFSTFEKLGDQEILQEELTYVIEEASNPANNARIFGFAPRYSEYKFYNHTVKGGFRLNYKYWSQSRFFLQSKDSGGTYVQPTLSPSFIKPDIPSFNRIYQTISSDYTLKPYLVKFENRTIAFRPMEEQALGYLIDHF